VSCFIVAGIDHVVVYSFLAKINSDSVGQPKSVLMYRGRHVSLHTVAHARGRSENGDNKVSELGLYRETLVRSVVV